MEPPQEEYLLAVQASAGDPGAVADLVEKTRLRLFTLAYAELRHYDDAQDAVAAALLRICLHISDLREPAHVIPWMQSIVRREARALRRGPTSRTLDPDAPDLHTPGVNALMLRLDIEEALRHLPGRQAQAIRLFYLEGFSVREIAQQLGGEENMVTEGRVKVWLHRGRQRLTIHMEGYAPMNNDTSNETSTVPQLPPRRAAILHANMSADLLAQMEAALRQNGFTLEVVSPAALQATAANDIPQHIILQGYHAIIIDEQVGVSSGLEWVLFCKAHMETADTPIILLHSQQETPLLTTACFAVGVDLLVQKNDLPRLVAALRSPSEAEAQKSKNLAGRVRQMTQILNEQINTQTKQEPSRGSWSLFTERARRVVYFAQVEAGNRKSRMVFPEDFLLAIIHESDCAAARILTEKFAVPPEIARQRIIQQGLPVGGEPGKDMQLEPRARQVVDEAHAEAGLLGHNYIGTEHLLLGLLHDHAGSAGHALAELGVTLDHARKIVAAWQQEAF